MRDLQKLIGLVLLAGALFAIAGCSSSSGLYEPGSTTDGSSGRSGSTTVVIHGGYYGRGWGYPGYYPPGGGMGPPPMAVPYY